MTERQIQVVKNLPKYDWVFRDAMLASGYSYTYASNPHRLKSTKGYNKLMKSTLEKSRAERERLLDEMKDRDLTPVKYTELVGSLEKVDKVIRLSEGSATDITENKYSDLTDAQLRAIQKRGDEESESSGEGVSEEGIGEKEAN